MQHDTDEGTLIYKSDKHWFTVHRTETGLILHALGGTAGLTIVSKELRPDEVEMFEADPETLARVARQLCDDWANPK